MNESARAMGQQVRRFHEVVPANENELIALLRDVCPWREQWDTFALEQIVPAEAAGKKIGWMREKHLTPIRVRIAHALLDTGEVTTFDKMEQSREVNRWLPLCRILARLLLRNEFPYEFELMMMPFGFDSAR